jgi:ribulose-5-phosphate 4-epimerase/fuculose-1-phosphate aldolase
MSKAFLRISAQHSVRSASKTHMSKAFLRIPSKQVSTSATAAPLDPIEQALRRDLAIAHRLIAHNQQDELIWNHISARHHSWAQGKYLVTPGDTHFALIEPKDLVLMGGDDNDLQNVTADVIHGAVFQCRPDVMAIVHIHSEAGMYVSCLPGRDPLQYFTQDGGGFYGKVAYHDFEGVATDKAEQVRIQKDMTTRTAVGALPDVLIMRQHGTTCCGSSVGAAYVKNFYMDRVCRVQMNLNQANAKAAPISDDNLNKMKEQFERADLQHGCEWPAMVRYAEKYLGCDEF